MSAEFAVAEKGVKAPVRGPRKRVVRRASPLRPREVRRRQLLPSAPRLCASFTSAASDLLRRTVIPYGQMTRSEAVCVRQAAVRLGSGSCGSGMSANTS